MTVEHGVRRCRARLAPKVGAITFILREDFCQGRSTTCVTFAGRFLQICKRSPTTVTLPLAPSSLSHGSTTQDVAARCRQQVANAPFFNPPSLPPIMRRRLFIQACPAALTATLVGCGGGGGGLSAAAAETAVGAIKSDPASALAFQAPSAPVAAP